jgi:hypothetical protein
MVAAAAVQVERLAATTPMIEALGRAAMEVEAFGLATAAFMLKESLDVYAKEMKKFLNELEDADCEHDDCGLDD